MDKKLLNMYSNNKIEMDKKFIDIQAVIDTYNRPNIFIVLTTYSMLSMLDADILKVLREECYRYRILTDNTLILTNIIKFITARLGDIDEPIRKD